MKPTYTQTFTLTDTDVDCFGRMKLSSLLTCAQEVAGKHSALLGADYDHLLEKQLFWAVSRHRVQITRLPLLGESITVETWPMPTTRVAYPRSLVAFDADGNEVFRSISLWVLMDIQNRSMVLPGKSGVEVNGTLTGSELAPPHSLVPKTMPNTVQRTVTYTCLDRNGHMNNTRYLDWVEDLLPASFHRENTPKELVICYLNEALENHVLQLQWELTQEGILQVDAHRENTDVSEKSCRVFSAQVLF